MAKLIKAEKREKIKEKRKNAPKGGTLGGELKRLQTAKFYAHKNKKRSEINEKK